MLRARMPGTIVGMPGKTSSTVELLRLIENVVRAGTVMAVDHGAHLCRVRSGGLETNWLLWFARCGRRAALVAALRRRAVHGAFARRRHGLGVRARRPI